MENKLRFIEKTDLVSYVRIKGVEDYTYTDMLTTLENSNYDNIPESFVTYMSRAIEDTITRIYPKTNTKSYTKEGDMYKIPNNGGYKMLVRYRDRYHTKNKVDIVGYTVDKVVTKFEKSHLENFIYFYMNFVITNIIRLTLEGTDYIDPDIIYDVVGTLFTTITKITMYINNELNKEWEKRISVKDRVDGFMKLYKNNAERSGVGVILNLDKWIIGNFKGYDKL